MSDDDCGRGVPSDDELSARAESQQIYPDELQDVSFPYASACWAIATCRRVASMLDTDLTERAEMVSSLDDWTGGYRDDFDLEWSSIESMIAGIKEGLQLLAGDIEDAWDDADDINASRQETRESDDYDPQDYDPYSGR